jgi:hypothetical protein
MGEFVPAHALILDTQDDTKLPVTVIRNPIYIPKIGEVFSYKDISYNEADDKVEVLFDLEVVSCHLDVQVFMVPEQVVVLGVRKVG